MGEMSGVLMRGLFSPILALPLLYPILSLYHIAFTVSNALNVLNDI